MVSLRELGSGKILEEVFVGGASEQTTEASSCAGWPDLGCVLMTSLAGGPGGTRLYSLSLQGQCPSICPITDDNA